jgi:acetyl esterase
MIHHFYGLGGAIPYAASALAAIGAEIREAFAGTRDV